LTSLDVNSSWNARFLLAPSIKFQVGSRVRFPISIGPVFSLYREESWSSTSTNKRSFYESFSLGVKGDFAMVVNPSRWFFLRHGFSLEWDFLRTERGRMDSDYRTENKPRFKGVPYYAFVADIYLGIGIRFPL